MIWLGRPCITANLAFESHSGVIVGIRCNWTDIGLQRVQSFNELAVRNAQNACALRASGARAQRSRGYMPFMAAGFASCLDPVVGAGVIADNFNLGIYFK